MARNTGNTILALITGAAIGVGAGILFAPEDGKKTRKKIKKSFDETQNELKKRVEKLSEQVKLKATDMKGTLEENVENVLSKSSYKAEEAISVLEKKLADLKKANAKLQK